jgi:hypothetical protein
LHDAASSKLEPYKAENESHQDTRVIGFALGLRALRGLFSTVFLFAFTLQAAPLAPVDVASLDADWQALFESMHAVDRVAAPFEEARSFSFRKEPKRYRGVFRKDVDGRVSLAYTEPEKMALHLGEGFAYYRKGDGAIRRIPQSNAQSEALALFPKLLNFDLVPIADYYAISGTMEGDAWKLRFEAKDASADELPYQAMEIRGQGTAVQRIELSKSETQVVLIEMGDPVYPEFYLPEAKAAYFFTPDPE